MVEGNIGSVGAYDIEFVGGKLVAKATVSNGTDAAIQVAADVSVTVGAGAVIDALEKAIPGTLSKDVLELIRKGLGA